MITNMKFTFSTLILIIILALPFESCRNKKPVDREPQVAADTNAVPDTGYTGIKQYMSGRYIVKEVTFKNGVREGLMKTFYETGEVRQTFWYENGFREDSSVWLYKEGQKFRTTPYKKDTIDGIQKQYFRDGRLKAKIGYTKGLRNLLFEEYDKNGKLIKGYPTLTVNTNDEYKSGTQYKITIGVSDKKSDFKLYRGDLRNGLYDTAHVEPVKVINGTGTIILKKSSSSHTNSVGVIAEILTDFGNRLIVYRKIDLPYNDLK
jgi:hypothetical protein